MPTHFEVVRAAALKWQKFRINGSTELGTEERQFLAATSDIAVRMILADHVGKLSQNFTLGNQNGVRASKISIIFEDEGRVRFAYRIAPGRSDEAISLMVSDFERAVEEYMLLTERG